MNKRLRKKLKRGEYTRRFFVLELKPALGTAEYGDLMTRVDAAGGLLCGDAGYAVVTVCPHCHPIATEAHRQAILEAAGDLVVKAGPLRACAPGCPEAPCPCWNPEARRALMAAA